MPDTPLHTLIAAARAEGADELADAAEGQLQILMCRDPEHEIKSVFGMLEELDLVSVTYAYIPYSGGKWRANYLSYQKDDNVCADTLQGAVKKLLHAISTSTTSKAA